MAEYDDLKRLLKSMGLNEYQTEAYLSLLIHGDLTAEEISENGKIPLPRVYDTLKDLCHNMGIVLISHSRPKVYRAMESRIAVKKLVKLRKDHLEGMLDSIEKDAEVLLKELNSSSKKPHVRGEKVVWYYKIKGDPMGAERSALQQATSKEYLSFSGDVSWLKDDREQIKELKRKGVDIKILANRNANSTIVKLASSIGIPMRIGGIDVRGVISDGRTAVIVSKRFNGVKTEHEVLKTDNPMIVSMFRHYFMTLWNNSKKAV